VEEGPNLAAALGKDGPAHWAIYAEIETVQDIISIFIPHMEWQTMKGHIVVNGHTVAGMTSALTSGRSR
jgi:hypothetical protein